LGLLALGWAAANSQTEVSEARRYHDALGASRQWAERAEAFYRLTSVGGTVNTGGKPWSSLPGTLAVQPGAGDQLRLDLIRALSMETAWMKSQATLPESFTNYHGDLLAAVASLSDIRSCPVLLQLVDSGNMALDALAGFGEAALDPTLRMLAQGPDDITRLPLVRLLAKMTEPTNLTRMARPDSGSAISAALVLSLKDPHPFVRLAAVDGLANLKDPATLPALENVAAEDPFQSPATSTDPGGYIVRQRAARAVREIGGGR